MFLALFATAFVQAARRQDPRAGEAAHAVLVPFLVEEHRVLGVSDAEVLVANAGPEGTELVLERLRVSAGGLDLVDQALGHRLPGDPRFARANSLIERLPSAERHGKERRAFAAADEAPLAGDAALAAQSEIEALVQAMGRDYAAGLPEPFLALAFPLATDQVFAPEDPPGTRRTLVFTLDYPRAPAGGAAGPLETLTLERELVRGRAPLSPPAALKELGFALFAGDLHVHSCHGEALGACAPSTNCAAETFQTSGSFSYAELKSQYQALGLSWFSATDHSYCINSDSEYDLIAGECAALTDAAFVALPDTELSSDEVGPQIGSDVGDLACLGTTEANHMGAHGISTRKPGGSDGLLGFCDGLFSDALAPFTANIAAVRAEGGYAIANHPADGSSFGWNSYAATQGLEAGGLHGVEIWNGATQTGQGGQVGRWVDWLLDGRILYAYSGSDTHDAAFAFGANHVLLEEPLSATALEKALKAGRSFVSSEHVLVLEILHAGAVLPMGTLEALAPGTSASALTLRVHYNFGADSASITIFRGRVGDAAESVSFASGPLSGEGLLEVSATLDPSSRTWYRAYSEGAGETAYTNPVFFLPGSCAYSAFGAGLGGANTGALTSASSPTIASFNTLQASFPGALGTPVFFAASLVQIPAGAPLLGGFLLIGFPPIFSATGLLAGGQGAFAYQVPNDPGLVGGAVFWQAAALDPGAAQGFAFTNGLALTVCDLLQ
jgi:hypothetical protein